MPFNSVLVSRRKMSTSGGGGQPGTGEGIHPYIGIANWYSPRTQETILNLRQAQRGPNPSRMIDSFSIAAEGNDGYWLAYPKIYGPAIFNEIDQNGNIVGIGEGGWDGANGDPYAMSGPLELDMTIEGVTIPFLLYMSDWPGLGQMYWRVT